MTNGLTFKNDAVAALPRATGTTGEIIGIRPGFGHLSPIFPKASRPFSPIAPQPISHGPSLNNRSEQSPEPFDITLEKPL